MSLNERIKEARKRKGITQEQLGILIGVAKTTVAGYENNREPTAAKVGEIADALEVDVNFLFQDEVKALHDNHATPEEFEKLVKPYRTLDPIGRSHVDTVIDWETERVEQIRATANMLEEQAATTIELEPHTARDSRFTNYFYDASAGSGIFILGNESTDKISIPATPENSIVDYVIKVSGDSMMPDYHDGDNVMVSQRVEMMHGDVGIFIVNGKAYIKEYGEIELISRNPNSPNIKISEHDNIVCMGKVIGKLEEPFEIINNY